MCPAAGLEWMWCGKDGNCMAASYQHGSRDGAPLPCGCADPCYYGWNACQVGGERYIIPTISIHLFSGLSWIRFHRYGTRRTGNAARRDDAISACIACWDPRMQLKTRQGLLVVVEMWNALRAPCR